MDESCGATSGWFSVGHIWWHTKGMEESSVDAELIDVSTSQVRMLVRTSWGVTDDAIIGKGSHETYQEPGGPVWRVYCDDVSVSMSAASIRICYTTEPEPKVCSDYTNQVDCNAAGCYWYDGACHGTPDPEPKVCSDYTNQVGCESAGCKWEDGVCKVSDTPPEPVPDGSTRMELNRDVSFLGLGFKLREIDCARGEALVEFVGTGLRRLLILGGVASRFPVATGVVYMAAVWVNSECTEIAVRGMAAPKDPEQKGADTDSGKTIDEMDVEKFASLEIMLDPDGIEDITIEELKKRDIDAHAITQGDKPPHPDWVTKEQWDALIKEWDEIMEDLAAGRITIEEAWALWDDAVVAAVVDSFIDENFTLLAPNIVMAGSDLVVSGRTPKKNMRIQIMAVKKYLGYDWLATDKVLKEVTSDDFFQYETTLVFDDFGAVAVYARAPKEWYEFWIEDHDTDKVSVWVLTWTMVIALLLGVGLILEKKYNKLGLFTKGR